MAKESQGVVTTAAHATPAMKSRAVHIAHRLKVPYIPRGRQSLQDILEQGGTEWALVVSRDGIFLHVEGMHYRYHPGMAVSRLRQVLRGGGDPLLEVAGIRPGDMVVDATLGLGADSILLSHAVGETGRVVGVEDSPVIAFLVEEGMRTYVYPALPDLERAMRRIEVISADHLEYLRSLPDRSVDVVYFDPMFRETVVQSRGIDALRHLGNPSALRPEAVAEAKRVARRCVVMKERRGSEEFARLGFTPVPKGSGRVQFGVIHVEE